MSKVQWQRHTSMSQMQGDGESREGKQRGDRQHDARRQPGAGQVSVVSRRRHRAVFTLRWLGRGSLLAAPRPGTPHRKDESPRVSAWAFVFAAAGKPGQACRCRNIAYLDFFTLDHGQCDKQPRLHTMIRQARPAAAIPACRCQRRRAAFSLPTSCRQPAENPGLSAST